MEEKFCQSCGMAITKPELYGTEKNGEPSADYCRYCYKNGAFQDWCKSMTLDEMVENNIRFLLEAGAAKTADEARAKGKAHCSKLKRWS